jgi:hypothetical protein
MALVSDIEIRLRADIARLQQDMNAARRSVDTAMGRIAQSAEVAKKALGALAAGFGLKEIATQVLGAQREFDKLNSSLITATGSTTNAAAAFKALQAFAAATPYSVSEATEAFIKLRNLGLTPSERALGSYGNTAAAMGKGLNQMIEAVADAATGEFERLKEFGIKAKQNGDKVSLTFQGVTKTIGNNAKDIEAYLMRLGEVEFAGAMERRANTLDGAISALGDTWQSVMRAISSNGIGEGAMSGVIGLTNALGDLSRMLEAVGAVTTKEGEKVKESSIIHESLTGIFRGLLVIGINVKNVIGGLADGIVALATAAGQAAQGDFADAKKTMEAASIAGQKRMQNWKDELQATVETHQAVKLVQKDWMAGYDQLEKAQTSQVGNMLGGFAVVQTAAEKQAAAGAAIVDIQNRINGVNKDAAGELAKLKTAYETGAISQAEYARLVGRINKETTLASTAYKDQVKALDLSSDAIQRRAAAQAFANKQAEEQLAFMNRTGQLNDADYITKRGAAEVKALQDSRAALEQQLGVESKRLDNAQKLAALRGQIAQADQEIAARGVQTENELYELDLKLYRQAVETTVAREEAAESTTRSLREQLQAQQDETAEIGLTERQVRDLTTAREYDKAAALDRRAEMEINETVAAQLREQADLTRQIADGKKYAEQARETKKFWGDVEKTAHDTFVSIADGGKNAFTRLKESAKNIFFEWLYQMTLKKWIVNISASSSGGGIASAFGEGGSGGSNAMDLISTGKKIYEGFSSGFTSVGAGLGSYVSTLGNIFGSSSISAFGSGMGLTSAQAAQAAAAYNSAGMTGVGSSLTAGSSFGAAAGAAAGIGAGVLGGIYGGRAISGGYGHNGAVNTGVAAGAAIGTAIVPVLGTAIGALLGGILGGTYNRAFGYKPKEFSDTSMLNGTLGASGFSGTLDTDWVKKGGWFRSDKHGTQHSSIDSAMSDTLAKAYKAVQDATAGYATVLGLNADAIKNRTETVKLALGKDNAANEKAITDFFGGLADKMAAEVLPNVAKFQAQGETVAVTLERLVGNFSAVNTIMSAMGVTADKAFGAAGIASIEARERLLALAGGLDALASQTAFFNQNFLTKAEQIAPVQKQVQDQLTALGYAGLTTVDQYKAAVQGLVTSGALATEAGAKAYAGLLQLAPTFKLVADAAREAAEAQKDVVSKAHDKLLGELQKQIDSVNGSIEKTRDLSRSLKDALGGMSVQGSGEMARASARAQITAALQVARSTGVLPDVDDLRDALSAVSQTTTDQYATFVDYLRDTARTAGQIAELGGITDAQTTIQEQQLAAAVSLVDKVDAAYAAEIARLDAQVSLAQQQISATQSVDAAVRQLLATAQSAPVPGAAAPVPMFQATPVATGQQSATMGDNSAILAELQTLNRRMANVETNTKQFSEQFDNATGGGGPLLVKNT